MKETIELLRKLQDIDGGVTSKIRERDDKLRNIGKARAILDRGGRALEERRERQAEAEKFLREANDELQTIRDNIRRMQARLGSLSKTKELNAAQREIDNQQRQSKQKEEEISKLSEEISKFRDGTEGDEKKLGSMRAEVGHEEKATASYIDALSTEIDSVADAREAIESQLPKPLVRRYRRVSKAREGVAVVEVREGQCSGCNRQVPPQLRIRLLRGETLEECPYCSRYIYAPDEEVGRYENGVAAEE